MLIEYLNNNQSSNGFFYNDIIYNPNFLASSITILTINNLTDKYLQDDINYLRIALNNKIKSNNIQLIELYYALKILKETTYFSQDKDYIKTYFLSNRSHISNIKDAYYFIKITEDLDLSLDNKIKNSIIDLVKDSLSQFISSMNPPFELIAYGIEILQGFNETDFIDYNKQRIINIINNSNDQQLTIMDQFYISKCFSLLSEPLSNIININYSKDGGIKMYSDKEIVTLQSTYIGTELIKLQNIIRSDYESKY